MTRRLCSSMYELAARKTGNIAYRAAVGVALAAALLLVWINLAVGIIGNEDNPANLMYIGVLAVGTIGAIIARFQPHGMARALFATALAQGLVVVIALIAGKQHSPISSCDRDRGGEYDLHRSLTRIGLAVSVFCPGAASRAVIAGMKSSCADESRSATCC